MTTRTQAPAPRFYAACLASYNNGVLHGAWIDASESTEEMQDAINTMLRASKFPNVLVDYNGQQVASAEEWAMHDSEGLPSSLGEYAGLEAIAKFMTFYTECEQAGLADIALDMFDDDIDPEDYAGQGDTLTDWCASFLEETGELDAIPEHLRNYFDHEAYARDMELGGDIQTIRACGSLHVFWNR